MRKRPLLSAKTCAARAGGGEIDYYLLGLLEQELQEKYFVVTGREDDHFWNREYSLKPGIRAEQVPEPATAFRLLCGGEL